LQSFAQGLFNGTCIFNLVYKPTYIVDIQESKLLLYFIFERKKTDRVPMKGNYVDCGPA